MVYLHAQTYQIHTLLALLVTLFFLYVPTATAGTLGVLWTEFANYGGQDSTNDVAVDATGVYVIGWFTNADTAWHVEKRDLATGNLIIWSRSEDPTDGADRPSSAVVDGGALYVIGEQGIKSGADSKWRIEKRDLSTGALVSGFGTGGVVISDPRINEDRGLAVAVYGNGLYLGGFSEYTSNTMAWRLEKRDKTTGLPDTSFATNGVYESYGTAWETNIKFIQVNSSGIYIVGATNDSTISRNRILEKLDFSGNVLWSKESTLYPRGVVIDGTGVYVLEGIRKYPCFGPPCYSNLSLSKFDTDGNTVWSVATNYIQLFMDSANNDIFVGVDPSSPGKAGNTISIARVDPVSGTLAPVDTFVWPAGFYSTERVSVGSDGLYFSASHITGGSDTDIGSIKTEKPPPPACSDGIDNDIDGDTDFPFDLGCANAADTSEDGPAWGCTTGTTPASPSQQGNDVTVRIDTLDFDLTGHLMRYVTADGSGIEDFGIVTSPYTDTTARLLTAGDYTYRFKIDEPPQMTGCEILHQVVAPTPPTATLEVRALNSSDVWAGSINILPGEEVEFRWSSTDAVSCLGTGFSTGGQTGDPTPIIEKNITEPVVIGSSPYSVTCYSASGVPASGNVSVTLIGDVTLTMDLTRVRQSATTTITWDSNGRTGCQIVGTNGDVIDASTVPAGSTESSPIYGETTYTMSCDAGPDATVTVFIYPIYEEI